MGNSFVYNTGEAKAKKNEIDLVFGVFIDGTLNNKTNTDLRRLYRNNGNENLSDERIKASVAADEASYKRFKEKGFSENPGEYEEYIIASHRTFMDKQGTDNSYSNDYTNVARMWKYCAEDYKVYVEGMGTEDKKKDSQDGFAFGSGLTGVRAKVRKACELVAVKVGKIREENKNVTIGKITFDVFGFSRGAASARNFVNEVNVKRSSYPATPFNIPDGYKPLRPYVKEQVPEKKYRKALVDKDELEIDESLLVDGMLPKYGHLGYSLLANTDLKPDELADIVICIRFIGLYDTVSSYGEEGKGIGTYDEYGKHIDAPMLGKAIRESISSHFNDDVEQLQLNELGYFQKMVHFTAKDEHRRNFDLTRIELIQGSERTVEKNFPGVHCDIGGAYENETEYKDEIETTNHKALWEIGDYREKLIADGWFNADQIDIRNKFGAVMGLLSPLLRGFLYGKLTGTRYLKKEYSYIPLHFMEDYCKPLLGDNLPISLVEQYKIDDDNILVKAKTYLQGYIDGEIPEWEFLSDEELEKIKQKRIDEINYDKLQEALDNVPGYRDGYLQNYNATEIKGVTPEVVPTVAPEEDMPTTQLEEVIVVGSHPQSVLRRLRNEYLHWSSSRDWFGMEPRNDRKRVEH